MVQLFTISAFLHYSSVISLQITVTVCTYKGSNFAIYILAPFSMVVISFKEELAPLGANLSGRVLSSRDASRKPKVLALKVPNKKCSRQHFNFLLLSFKKIRLDFSCESSA